MAWRRLGVLTLLLCHLNSAAAVTRVAQEGSSVSWSADEGVKPHAGGQKVEQQKRRGADEDGRLALARRRSHHAVRAREEEEGTPEEDAKIMRALKDAEFDADDPAMAAPVIGPGSAVEAIRAGKPLVTRKPKFATAGGDFPQNTSAASLPKRSSALSSETPLADGNAGGEVGQSAPSVRSTPPAPSGELVETPTSSATVAVEATKPKPGETAVEAAERTATTVDTAAIPGDLSASEKIVPTSRPMPRKKPKNPGCYMFMPSGCPNQGPEHDAANWTHDTHAENKMKWEECETIRAWQLNLWCGVRDVKMLFIPRPDQFVVTPPPPQPAGEGRGQQPQELLSRPGPYWPLPRIKIDPKEVVHEKKKLKKVNTQKEEEKREKRRLKKGDSEEDERPLKPWYLGEKLLEKLKASFHKKKWQSPEAEAAHQRVISGRKREEEVRHMKVLNQAIKDEAKRIANTPKQRLWSPPKSVLPLGLLETDSGPYDAPAAGHFSSAAFDAVATRSNYSGGDDQNPCSNTCTRGGKTATCTVKIWTEATLLANRMRGGGEDGTACWDAQITISKRCPQCLGCMPSDARCPDFLKMNPLTTTPAPPPEPQPSVAPPAAAGELQRSPEVAGGNATAATGNATAGPETAAPAREGGSGEGPEVAAPLPNESFCCLAAPAGKDACGSCAPNARLGKGSWCSESSSNCEFCQANATYCARHVARSAEAEAEEPGGIIRTSDGEDGKALPAAPAEEVAGGEEPVQEQEAPEKEPETPFSTAGSVHDVDEAERTDQAGAELVNAGRRVNEEEQRDADRAMQATGYQAGAIRAAMDAVRKAREPKMEPIKHLGPADRKSGPEAELPTEVPPMTKREVQVLQRKELRAARRTAEAAKKDNVDKQKRLQEKEAARSRLQSYYVLADPGHRCLQGLTPVNNVQECSLAARIYNAKDDVFWGKRWKDRPRGCFLNVANNHMIFNTGKGGEADQDFKDRTVCVPTGAGLPTVPPGFEQAQVYDPTADKQFFPSLWHQ